MKGDRVSATNKIFAASRLDFFREPWKKFFGVSFLIRHVDFDDGIARSGGLGMEALNGRRAKRKTPNQGQRDCGPGFHDFLHRIEST